MHAKNTSQKVRAVLKSKGESGISLANNIPYGYKKYENDKTKWIIDEQLISNLQLVLIKIKREFIFQKKKEKYLKIQMSQLLMNILGTL